MESPLILVSAIFAVFLVMILVGIYLKKQGWTIRPLNFLIRLFLVYTVASLVHGFIGLLQGLAVLVLGFIIILHTSQRVR